MDKKYDNQIALRGEKRNKARESHSHVCYLDMFFTSLLFLLTADFVPIHFLIDEGDDVLQEQEDDIPGMKKE